MTKIFHPDFPGLAFVGMFEMIGPYFPVLEIQARWVAYSLSGACPSPSEKEMLAGVESARKRRDEPQEVIMHNMALLFARETGIDPDIRLHQ